MSSKKARFVSLILVFALLAMGLGVASAAPPAQEGTTYTVKLGDNLWTLAEKYLGNGAAYPAIAGATNDKTSEDETFAQIANPSLIHPGWKLVIPVTEALDLTGETITIYHFGDLSGPYAAITGPLIHGAEDAVAAINEAGGLYGATLALKFADTAGSIDEAVAAYDRFTGEGENPLVMITYGSGEVEALAQRFAEDKIVNLTAGLSARGFYVDSGYTFGLGPIYPDQIGAVMAFLKDNWDTYKPADAGDEIKLAYLSWPTAFGQGALTDESRAYLADLGIEVVAERPMTFRPRPIPPPLS
jgi:ABC-type branched-subunit amino acid transport system substrate-binding protein